MDTSFSALPLMQKRGIMSVVLDNFLRYVKVDTQSQPDADCYPSTAKQLNLLRMLYEELLEMGASNVRMAKEGYVYATIPATDPNPAIPALGFIAHVDTSDAVSGCDVKPRIIEKYDGGIIVLNEALGMKLTPTDYPAMLSHVGEDFIVTDGTTLLGADDKAGVAEIMAAARYLIEHPEIPHGTVQVAFTPDEEVGRGVEFFDIQEFGADFAYTIDGGEVGEIEYENFNAANLRITIQGKSIHPGSAKGHMINSLLVAMELQQMLPAFENPAYTEGYEGFYHLTDMTGSCEKTTMEYILRDHDEEKLQDKLLYIERTAEFLNHKYGTDTVTIKKLGSYRNMKEKILPHMHLIENAKKAMERIHITPAVMPIRGGTDGANLSWMGLPCPNLCTGGHNYHGCYEYITVQNLEKCTDMILEIIKVYTEQASAK